MSKLHNKTAIVTGATGGIGQAVAECYAEQGARVVFTGRDGARAEQAATQARACGGEAIGLALDVTRPIEIDACIDKTLETFGSIDILFNAAGAHANRSLHEITFESFSRVWNVNVTGLASIIRDF